MLPQGGERSRISDLLQQGSRKNERRKKEGACFEKKTANAKPDCPVSKNCGGCAFSSVSYSEQLKKKEKTVKDLLSPICEVRPIEGAKEPYFYRNKVHWAFGHMGTHLIAGRYAEGSHRIIENDNCLLEDEELAKILSDIRDLAVQFKIRAYDERTKQGLLRRVLLRKGMATGEVMVVLVLSSPVLPGKKGFIKKLLEKHPSVKTILININTRSDSMILGEKTICEFGRGSIRDELLGVQFKISPESFYQINHDQTEKLYSLAIKAADLKPGEKILDAYCGIGTIGLCAAANAEGIRLTGVELNRAAVTDARENAKINSEKNSAFEKARFIAADCTKFMLEASAKNEKYDVVFLDPPRAGTTPEFIAACQKLAPKRIVYVSCDPTTLARDLKEFKKHGYRAEYAVPVDMFPLTEHVETCVLLSKLSRAPKLEVTVKMSELDITEAEAKASYQEIQDYVMENTG
ncbi:MAG: 23S rRNA (uracil(1939)-C(5))-methyltransferase RlmD, partial [Clostridiales bacterium]|nr:23S rRNA (uracil(1939)-C(5))-methyltransferase RlmD [Clostridiales bacterium]